MKLVLKKNRHVTWPVMMSQAANGGGLESVELDVTFSIIENSEYEDILNNAQLTSVLGDPEILKRVVKHIDGLAIEDEDGVEQPFTPALLPNVLENMAITSSLIKAYMECAAGFAAKNV
jgi:hypothetical protein